MANKIYDLVEVRKIKDRDKPVYINHGILLVKEDGKMSVKLSSIPVGAAEGEAWDGWLSVFEKKKKDGQAPAHDPDHGSGASDYEPF